MPVNTTTETMAFSTNTSPAAAAVDIASSVTVLTAESASRSFANNHSSKSDELCLLHPRNSATNTALLNCETAEQEEEADRIEAELDEMARYIGPVAKSLFTPVVAPLVDANSFADALGVSPLYKQKE